MPGPPGQVKSDDAAARPSTTGGACLSYPRSVDQGTGSSGTAQGPERFLVCGRLEVLPRRRADRDMVLRYVASRTTGVHEPTTETTSWIIANGTELR